MRKWPAVHLPTNLGLLGQRSSPRLFWSGVALTIVLVLSQQLSSLAHARPAKSGGAIACFHPKINRFTAQAAPSRCNIAGYRGGEFVEVPIEGMKWGHWGSNPTRAALGFDKNEAKAVRIVAHRLVECDDGRRWYSRAVVVYPGDGSGFLLRLPTCVHGRTGPEASNALPAP